MKLGEDNPKCSNSFIEAPAPAADFFLFWRFLHIQHNKGNNTYTKDKNVSFYHRNNAITNQLTCEVIE